MNRPGESPDGVEENRTGSVDPDGSTDPDGVLTAGTTAERDGDDIRSFSVAHSQSGFATGRTHPMWRCTICGEVGGIDDRRPSACPNCVNEEEEVMWWIED